MAVITISREYGTDAEQIARAAAERLGCHLADKETIGKILASYGIVDFKKVYETIPAFWEAFDAQKTEQRRAAVDMLNRVILALARHGNVVIEGRGGNIVLGAYRDVLNVRIQEPAELRIRNLMEREQIPDIASADAFIAEKDRVRNYFIEENYRRKSDDIKGFDLVIDTAKIGRDKAVMIIASACEGLRMIDLPGSKSVRDIPADDILDAVVQEVIDCSEAH